MKKVIVAVLAVALIAGFGLLSGKDLAGDPPVGGFIFVNPLGDPPVGGGKF